MTDSDHPDTRHPSNARERFDRWSSSYDSRRSRLFFERLHRRLAPLLAVGDARRVLDVGCGTGNLAVSLALDHPGVSVTGIDFSPGMISAAREKRSEEHTSELQSHSFISYAVFCLKKKKHKKNRRNKHYKPLHAPVTRY